MISSKLNDVQSMHTDQVERTQNTGQAIYTTTLDDTLNVQLNTLSSLALAHVQLSYRIVTMCLSA